MVKGHVRPVAELEVKQRVGADPCRSRRPCSTHSPEQRQAPWILGSHCSRGAGELGSSTGEIIDFRRRHSNRDRAGVPFRVTRGRALVLAVSLRKTPPTAGVPSNARPPALRTDSGFQDLACLPAWPLCMWPHSCSSQGKEQPALLTADSQLPGMRGRHQLSPKCVPRGRMNE